MKKTISTILAVVMAVVSIPVFSASAATTSGIRVIAHRGYSSAAPENTLASFGLAADKGYTYVETDIRLTKDGQWVLMHDASVTRTTNGAGNVASKTLAQIKSLKVNGSVNGKKAYPNEQVPTIDEFLDLCKKRNLKPVIELKLTASNVDYSYVIKAIKARGIEATFISFNLNQLQLIRKLDKNVQMYYLTTILTTLSVNTAANLGNCGVDFDYKFYTATAAAAAKKKGIELITYTIDTKGIFYNFHKDYHNISTFTTNKLTPADVA